MREKTKSSCSSTSTLLGLKELCVLALPVFNVKNNKSSGLPSYKHLMLNLALVQIYYKIIAVVVITLAKGLVTRLGSHLQFVKI